jgi:hypothetical protein
VFAGLVALLSFTFAAVVGVPSAVVIFLVVLGLGSWLNWRRGLHVSVDDQNLTVGTDRLPLAGIAAAIPLDEAALRNAAGPEADTRAHLVLRNLSTKTGVKIDLNEGNTPYWLVSSRRPQALAEVLTRT